MGIIATLLQLARGKLDILGNAPGKAAIMQGEGFEGQTIDTEVFQAPGVFGIPGDGVRGIRILIGNSSRYSAVVGVQNYQIEIDVGGQGGMAIYSTSADGKTVKSKVLLKPDGTVEVNGNSKRFVTWDELNTALQNHVHGAGLLVSPSGPVTGSTGAPIALDISAAKTSTVKTGG